MKRHIVFILVATLFQFSFLHVARACDFPYFLALFNRMADVAERALLTDDKAMGVEPN